MVAGFLWRDIFAKPRLTVLTILSVAWATLAICLMLAVGEGLRVNFNRAMANTGKDLLYITPGHTSQSFQGKQFNQPINLTLHDVQQIKKNVSDIVVLPEFSARLELRYKTVKRNVNLRGVLPEYSQYRHIDVQAGGRFIQAQDLQSQARVVVIGHEIARKLFPQHRSPVGLQVMINHAQFQVIGVTESKMQMWSSGAPDKYLLWMPSTTMQAMMPVPWVQQIIIHAKDSQNIAMIKQKIYQIIAYNHHANPQDPAILIFQDSHQAQKTTNLFFLGMQIFLGVIGALTLMVAGVNLANVTLIAIKQSTREIGIRMAIGARPREIVRFYLLQALVIILLGGVAGMLAADLIVKLVQLIPNSGQNNMLDLLKPIFSWRVAMIVITVLALIGAVAGYIPARLAARINPVQALRYE